MVGIRRNNTTLATLHDILLFPLSVFPMLPALLVTYLLLVTSTRNCNSSSVLSGCPFGKDKRQKSNFDTTRIDELLLWPDSAYVLNSL